MRSPHLVWALLAVALVARLIPSVALRNRTFIYDEAAYQQTAESLLDGRGFATRDAGMVNPGGYTPTSLWGCLQPLYLAGVFGLFGVKPLAAYLANALLGLIPVFIAFRLAERFAGSLAALVAGLFVAFDIQLIQLGVTLLSEPLYIALLALALWFLVAWVDAPGARNPVLAGVALALAALTRATAFYFCFVVLLWIALELGRRRGWLREVALFAGCFVLVLAPWVVRNRLVHDHPVLLDTKAGWNLYKYLHPEYDPDLDNDVELPRVAFDPKLSESARNQALTALAVSNFKEDPGRVIALAGSKAHRLWSPFGTPLTDPAKVPVKLAFLLPLELLALVGIVRWRFSLPGLRLFALLFLYYTAVHSVMVGGPRFRAPLDPALAVCAGLAFVRRDYSTSSSPSPSVPA